MPRHSDSNCPACWDGQVHVTLKLLLEPYCDKPKLVSDIVEDFTDVVVKAVANRPDYPRERVPGICADEIARASSALHRAHELLAKLDENGDLWNAHERLAIIQRVGEDLSEALCHSFVPYLGMLELDALFFRETTNPVDFHVEYKNTKEGQK